MRDFVYHVCTLHEEGAFTAAEVDMLQTVGMLEELEKDVGLPLQL